MALAVIRRMVLRSTDRATSTSPDGAHARIDDALDVRLEPHRAHERKRRRLFRGKNPGEPTRAAETLEDELIGKDAVPAVSALWALGNASAAVWQSAGRRAFILGARVRGLAALALHADLVRAATVAAAFTAVCASRTNTSVFDAHLTPQASATEDGLLLSTAADRDHAALRTSGEVRAAVLFTPAADTTRTADTARAAETTRAGDATRSTHATRAANAARATDTTGASGASSGTDCRAGAAWIVTVEETVRVVVGIVDAISGLGAFEAKACTLASALAATSRAGYCDPQTGSERRKPQDQL